WGSPSGEGRTGVPRTVLAASATPAGVRDGCGSVRSSGALRREVRGGAGESAGGVDQEGQGRRTAGEGGDGRGVPGGQGLHRCGQRRTSGEAGGEDRRQDGGLGGGGEREDHLGRVGEAVD